MSDKQVAYDSLIKYLCLEQYMGYTTSCQPLEFEAASLGIVITGHQACNMASTERFRALVIGKPMTAHQVCYMKCKMSKTQYALLGVCIDTNLELFTNKVATVYGWTTTAEQYENGVPAPSDILPWKSEDEVLLKADLKHNILQVRSTAGTTPQSLSLPELTTGRTYKFYAVLSDIGAGSDLLPVTELDKQLLP